MTSGQYEYVMDVLAEGDHEDLEYVRDNLDGFPDGVDFTGCPWIINAVDSGSLLSVTWMLAHNVDLTVNDGQGYTVLHACIDRAQPDEIEVLLALIAAGADLNARGMHDWTPLHMAACRGKGKAIVALLDAGADKTLRTRIDNYATPAEEARAQDVARLIEEYPAGAASRYPYKPR